MGTARNAGHGDELASLPCLVTKALVLSVEKLNNLPLQHSRGTLLWLTQQTKIGPKETV